MPNGTYVEFPLSDKSDQYLREWLENMGFRAHPQRYHCTTVYSKAEVSYEPPEWEPDTLVARRLVLQFLGKNLVLETPCHAVVTSHQYAMEQGATWDFPEYIPHITLVYNIDLATLYGKRLWTPNQPMVFQRENIFELGDQGRIFRE